jgi:histidine triad (HIT) family protein
MEDCIFCKIARGELPCFKVYEDDKVIAFADINPVSEGHTLVVPKAHSENLYEISIEDLTAVHGAAKKVVQAMKKALNPSGVAALQLNGRGVNQIVMHYHLHLIPRVEGSPPLPVSAWEIKQGDMDELKKVAERISTAF